MPNRIIKESIRTSKSINNMTDFQFRCWVYLITYVDDYGRGSADPELLKGFAFPRLKRLRESDIEKTLAELADLGAIHLYQVNGEPFFCFPNWSDHQRIQTKKSKFPAPITDVYRDIPSSTVTHGESPPESESKYESKYIVAASPPTQTGTSKKAFTAPTDAEVSAYCLERGNHIDSQHFIDYYTARGWVLSNGKKMVDWKAAVRTWERNNKPTIQSGGSVGRYDGYAEL